MPFGALWQWLYPFSQGIDALFEWSDFGCIAAGVIQTSFVATDDVPTLSNLKVYPAPTDGNITLAFELQAVADVGIEVYNMIGQRVLTLPPSKYMSDNQTVPIDVATLSNGMYWAVLRMRQGAQAIKFVVAR